MQREPIDSTALVDLMEKAQGSWGVIGEIFAWNVSYVCTCLVDLCGTVRVGTPLRPVPW